MREYRDAAPNGVAFPAFGLDSFLAAGPLAPAIPRK